MTTATVSPPLSLLLALLERQVALFEQLREMTQRQGACIRENAAESLLAILAQRQRTIDQIAQISLDMEPYRRAWTHFTASLPDGPRARVTDLVRRVQDLNQQIMAQDEADRRALEACKEQVARQLSGTRQAGAALRAYGRPVPGQQNRFTNQQG